MAYPREASDSYCPTGECVWDNIGGSRVEWCGPCGEHLGQPVDGEDVNAALVLKKVKIGLQQRVGVDTLRSLRISEVRDFVSDDFVLSTR